MGEVFLPHQLTLLTHPCRRFIVKILREMLAAGVRILCDFFLNVSLFSNIFVKTWETVLLNNLTPKAITFLRLRTIA